MDESMLDELFECSVCLERLNASSKMLPCQHTFCETCLKSIVTAHRMLCCPMCRLVVEAKVDDLPPNILLVRILERMCNAKMKQAAKMERANIAGPSSGSPGGTVAPQRLLGGRVSTVNSELAGAKPQSAISIQIRRYIQFFEHGSLCRDVNCCSPNCQRVKGVLRHTKNCNKRPRYNCPKCKQLIKLCCYHAKDCQETRCLVPLCSDIKPKIRQLQQVFPRICSKVFQA
ncbi:PREDICTED: SH3 domain-containing RING finger protein 3-like [Vollenhovia emeryi]|uniref:SH3 domain-containing RING finger protein 3-like n=1 Tax=Vollenhovia emeryi TaxID=411798 RepID=UPI0005F52E1E|nr:PREDICTED: SH3 domain-containing RING finger protein 3-like [Vollenhovia emeryi]XP_011880021.1 PREDICTED: SH3 domain-containing RING finger protein 3-like [Vollenhovia emeryi]XP_011880022.1 PREDICTED: SH3 domain-containing RING finger protein 3-like [Vollenhovia emeryi]